MRFGILKPLLFIRHFFSLFVGGFIRLGRSTPLILLLLSFTGHNNQQPLAQDLLEKMKQRNSQRLSEYKTKLHQLRKEVKEKNLKFRVSMTDALKKKLSEITGAKPPDEKKEIQKMKKRKKKNKEIFKKIEEQEKEKANAIEPEKPKKSKKPKKRNPVEPMTKKICSADAPSFDWREHKAVTPVKNQNTCGSCWAFTSASVLESAYLIKYSKNIDLAEQNILDCSVYPHNKELVGSCSGGWYSGVFSYLTTKPAALELSDPYKNRQKKCEPQSQGEVKTLTFGYVGDFPQPPTLPELKKALCDFGPLASSVKVTQLFQAYSGGVFDEHAKVKSPRDVNHAVTLVGWNDSTRSLLLKNSWGEGWGEKGYMRIEYGSNNIGYGTAWLIIQ